MSANRFLTLRAAIELEPDNGNLYVHRALLILSRSQGGGMMPGMAGVAGADAEEKAQAIRLIQSALAVDSKCEFALETLGMAFSYITLATRIDYGIVSIKSMYSYHTSMLSYFLCISYLSYRNA